jgi:hypothetical protein
MELTMAESVAEPPAEAGPIQFVWEDGNGQQTALISTTTSTTTSPTERFIARQKIEEHRRKPPHVHRIVPPLNANTLVPLDGGLVIRKRAAAQTGDVLTGQESAGTPPQRRINNPPSGSLSVGNLRGGRVTVLGVTEETILPGTTKGP